MRHFIYNLSRNCYNMCAKMLFFRTGESAMYQSSTNKSSPAYHLKSYALFQPFMDLSRYGTLMLVLREKDIPIASARIKAGMDIVDIFATGPSPENSQILNLHTLHKGDHAILLDHTYQYWAQPAELRAFLKEQYGLSVPKLSHSKKENGLLTCMELDGNHECYLPGRYVVRTFKLFPRQYHRCPEETAASPVPAVVFTSEHKKNSACPYCLAEELNLNL